MPGIVGIVGPNGAGKSTFFKLIIGMLKPNVGELHVLDQNPWKNTKLIGAMGLCPDYDNLPDDVTGYVFLKFVGGLHAMTGGVLTKRIEEVLQIVGMEDAVKRKIGTYSRGMRQRMKIAGAILHDPELLLLDEPLSGTDPIARRDLIELIKSLHTEHGHNIIASSHVLYEVERMTHKVGLIYKGRAVAYGDISEIRGLIDKHPHKIVIEGTGLNDVAKKILDMGCTVSVGLSPDRRSIHIQVSKPDEFFRFFPTIVADSNCEITRMQSLDDNLEAVFKYLVV